MYLEDRGNDLHVCTVYVVIIRSAEKSVTTMEKVHQM